MEVRGQTVLTSVELLPLFTLRAWERSSTATGVRRHTLPPIQTRLFTHSCRQREVYDFISRLSKLYTVHTNQFNKALIVTAQQNCTSRPSEQSCWLMWSRTCVAGSTYPSLWTAADSRSHTAAPVPASLRTDRYGNRDNWSTCDPDTTLTSVYM